MVLRCIEGMGCCLRDREAEQSQGEPWGGEHLVWALKNIRVLTGGWVSVGPPCWDRLHTVHIQYLVPNQKTKKAKFGCELGCLQGHATIHGEATSPG